MGCHNGIFSFFEEQQYQRRGEQELAHVKLLDELAHQKRMEEMELAHKHRMEEIEQIHKQQEVASACTSKN